jgi:hypothetical protein
VNQRQQNKESNKGEHRSICHHSIKPSGSPTRRYLSPGMKQEIFKNKTTDEMAENRHMNLRHSIIPFVHDP